MFQLEGPHRQWMWSCWHRPECTRSAVVFSLARRPSPFERLIADCANKQTKKHAHTHWRMRMRYDCACLSHTAMRQLRPNFGLVSLWHAWIRRESSAHPVHVTSSRMVIFNRYLSTYSEGKANSIAGMGEHKHWHTHIHIRKQTYLHSWQWCPLL